MALRVEFDPTNKVLLLHFEVQLLDDSVAESYRTIRKHWTATEAWVLLTSHLLLNLCYPATLSFSWHDRIHAYRMGPVELA
jgi:hypothetical protein